ncbi:MAG TPA: oxidoreductase [Paenibacillaceae bacterium]|nr:oxidoreductase [Paenibacillaceae bacterium]
MKNIILVLSVLMMVALGIGTYYYQKQDQMTYPKQYQPNHPDEPQQPKPLRPVNYEKISYSLQNNQLNITYNKGTDWVKVPIEKDLLFDGEYRGNKQELIEGSYILTENRAVFLYAKGNMGSKKILLTYSLDQGKTWQDAVVKESFPSIRFRKVDFLNNHFGYVIISGDRTMSQEYSMALLTHDGGKTWRATKDSGNTSLIYDGGFIDESTGFLSYGIINPEKPDLYVTQNVPFSNL